MRRRTPGLAEDVRPVLAGLGTSIVAADEAQNVLAQEGQVRFGLGRGKPPAVLSFGDLFAQDRLDVRGSRYRERPRPAALAPAQQVEWISAPTATLRSTRRLYASTCLRSTPRL